MALAKPARNALRSAWPFAFWEIETATTKTVQVCDFPLDVGDILGGKKLRFDILLLPFVSDLIVPFVVLRDFLFQLFTKVLVIAQLALQLASKGVQSSADGKGR
jgi:hypothetical protein